MRRSKLITQDLRVAFTPTRNPMSHMASILMGISVTQTDAMKYYDSSSRIKIQAFVV